MLKLNKRKVTMLTDDEVALVSGGGDTMDSQRCGSGGCWSNGCASDWCMSNNCISENCMSVNCESDTCPSVGCESQTGCFSMGCT